MSKQTPEIIKAKIIDIIVDKLSVKKEEVVPTATFTNDLGADSLDTVELIMEFEKEFGIDIADDHAEKITNVAEAMEVIIKKIDEKPIAVNG